MYFYFHMPRQLDIISHILFISITIISVCPETSLDILKEFCTHSVMRVSFFHGFYTMLMPIAIHTNELYSDSRIWQNSRRNQFCCLTNILNTILFRTRNSIRMLSSLAYFFSFISFRKNCRNNLFILKERK